MDTAFAAIQNWPALLQGVIGSALFWLLLTLGQRVSEWLTGRYSRYSQEVKLARTVDATLRLRARQGGWNLMVSAPPATVLLFRASRPLIKALMWLSLGLLFQTVIGILGVIGFIGALYYLFQAYAVVRPNKLNSVELAESLAHAEKGLAEAQQAPKVS
jgi:hypothetical protein